MGIRKLNKFLQETGLSTEYYDFRTFVSANKNAKDTCLVIGIDFLLYAHKFTYSYKNMIDGFLNQALKLLSYNIIPLYVFDGTSPKEKEAIHYLRDKKKFNLENRLKNIYHQLNIKDLDKNALLKEKERLEKLIININKNDINLVKKMFDIMHIPFIYASGEADAMCSTLYQKQIITACLSDDMDILVLGCKKLIKLQEGKIIEFDLDNILDKLGLTYDQFIEMGLLFGSDYLKVNLKIECIELYNLIKVYGSIENIIKYADHKIINMENDRCKKLLDKYNNIKDFYLVSPSKETITTDLMISISEQIDVNNLISLMITNNTNYINKEKILMYVKHINNNIKRGLFSKN